jgi:hypothetical protein
MARGSRRAQVARPEANTGFERSSVVANQITQFSWVDAQPVNYGHQNSMPNTPIVIGFWEESCGYVEMNAD